MHCCLVSSEAGTLNSVLCSSVQLKTEQRARFARTFAMVLELLETCRLGGNIITRSPFYVTWGVKSERLVFSQACRERLTKTNILGCSFSHLLRL